MNVFGYLRKSSPSQADNEGFPRQQAAIEALCAVRGWRVLRFFYEDATKGTTEAGDRDQFSEMLNLVGPETTDTVVVESADRLARDLMVSELACEEARKRGVHIIEAASGNDLTDSSEPTRVLLRQFLGALAQWNKAMLCKRMMDAKKRIRARSGRCEGRRGFGYKSIEDAETLELIMGFRKADWSFRDIALELTRRNRPTPEGPNLRPTTRGTAKKVWSESSVFYIFNRTQKLRDREETTRPPHAAQILSGLAV